MGVDGVNANPLSLHFRLTARDGRGGTNFGDTTLLLASGTGPFLVTSPNTAVSYPGESTQTITWDPAGTAAAPVSTSDVKIGLSVDGGHTYPYVLADSTPNDGSADVVLPMVGTTHARVKVEGSTTSSSTSRTRTSRSPGPSRASSRRSRARPR